LDDSSSDSASGREEKRAILLVDDEPFNLISAKMLLRNNFSQFQVHTAQSGAEAIQLVKAFYADKNRIEFIFMDLNMPV
jgi:CheY-like chemotaxis protein